MEAKPIPENDLPENIPVHIAIIMDGNGRWAKKRGLPRLVGHRPALKTCGVSFAPRLSLGLEVLTIYAFSTENWGRPADEVAGLMNILEEVIDKELQELNQEGVRLTHLDGWSN